MNKLEKALKSCSQSKSKDLKSFKIDIKDGCAFVEYDISFLLTTYTMVGGEQEEKEYHGTKEEILALLISLMADENTIEM